MKSLNSTAKSNPTKARKLALKPRLNQQTRFALSIAGLFMLVGFMIWGWPYISQMRDKERVSKNQAVVAALLSEQTAKPETPRVEGKPVRIEVPNVGIDLQITDGQYNPNNLSWTLSLNKAHFANITKPANNKEGLTFIYAHNRKGVFMTLPKVVAGDLAIVTTDNGKKFTYAYKSKLTVKPAETGIFDYQGPPVLVLQTCTGTWYQNRDLFTFELVKVE